MYFIRHNPILSGLICIHGLIHKFITLPLAPTNASVYLRPTRSRAGGPLFPAASPPAPPAPGASCRPSLHVYLSSKTPPPPVASRALLLLQPPRDSMAPGEYTYRKDFFSRMCVCVLNGIFQKGYFCTYLFLNTLYRKCIKFAPKTRGGGGVRPPDAPPLSYAPGRAGDKQSCWHPRLSGARPTPR